MTTYRKFFLGAISLSLSLFVSNAWAAEDDVVKEQTETTQNSDGSVSTTTTTTRGDDADHKGGLVLSLAGVVSDRAGDLDEGRNNDRVDVGGGILVEASVNDNFGIETGLLLVNRVYDVEANNSRLVEEVNRLHVPVVARFWATDFFSIAAGPYASFRTEDEEATISNGTGLETSADDDVEFGLDAAATVNLAMNDKTGLFLEGRYSRPFDEANNEDSDVVSGLVGLKLDL
jgi:hypothetical protein